MKWIVLAIVLCVVPYTIVTLQYRKPGPAFQPYEDMKNRANVTRLLAAGYQRIPIQAQRPADGTPAKGGASILPNTGGLPVDLRSTLVEIPLLAADIRQVTAAPTVSATESYSIELAGILPDDRHQLAGAELYVRGETIVILPTFEPTATDLVARSKEAVVLITVPAGALKPGTYMITLVAERASRSWPLEVR